MKRIAYSNDAYFKYLLANEKNDDSYYLLQMMIERLLHINCRSIAVLNPELTKENIADKNFILDIFVKVNDYEMINIEMQTSKLSKSLQNRFQAYGARMLSKQLHKGQSYNDMHPTYQIIFINDYDKDKPSTLISEYVYRTKKGDNEANALSKRIYVYLPVINDMINKKRELDEFETAVYIFKNGLQYVKIKLNQKVVDIMKKSYEKFNEEEALSWIAYNRQCGKWEHEMDMKESFEVGLKEGKTLGVEEGQREMSFQLLELKYGKHDNQWVDTLNQEQIKALITLVLTVNDYESLKKQVLLA